MEIALRFTASPDTSAFLSGKTVIILDVFRTSTTIITALEKGATQIIPTLTLSQARQLKKQKPAALLAGERNGQKIPGFNLGNSPLEYSASLVKNKEIILSTTNGIPALYQARSAAQVYLGSFANAPTLISHINKEKRDLILICAGTQGEYSLEDTCCAGYLLSLLQNTAPPFLDDKALGALALYHHYRKNLPYYLSRSKNGRSLLAQGHWRDLEYCCLQNSSTIIPLYQDFTIQALKNK